LLLFIRSTVNGSYWRIINQLEHYLECVDCGIKYQPIEVLYVCKKCEGLLDIKYDYEKIADKINVKTWLNRPFTLWRYREIFPVEDYSNIITLNEGGTSLHKCERLEKILNLGNIRVKNEGENPTGSFKDRGMTVGITRAIELGFQTVACASTGNTSASLAAYAARAGLRSIVLIPSGKIALGKLTQAIIHGAHIVQIKGNFDEALRAVFQLTHSNPNIYLLNSVNPYRIEGQKSIAYEIYTQLGNAPDNILLPVGNAGNISAIWKGFIELQKLDLITNLPHMIGIQAENAAPIVTAFKKRRENIHPTLHPETIATAIRIGSPISWKKALNAVYDSKGFMEKVTDEEIISAQQLLARQEGIFVEPASAASIAGLKKIIDMNLIEKDDKTVCIVTGHGLKDPDIVIKTSNVNLIEIDPLQDSIANALEQKPIAMERSL
jgi:threonine synthase